MRLFANSGVTVLGQITTIRSVLPTLHFSGRNADNKYNTVLGFCPTFDGLM